MKKPRRKRKPLGPPAYKVLFKKYGITEEDYKKLVLLQKGVCYICLRDPTKLSTRKYQHNLCVDHDHYTGEIRGLLCRHCNSMISRWLHDDVDKIKRVLKYFTRKNPVVSYHKVEDNKVNRST